MKSKREKWIDISKGILIILVVLGHSIDGPYYDLDNKIDYVYLFHMPAFFIISGYLYKPVCKKNSILTAIIKRIKRLLIPYFTYLFILNIPRIIYLFITTSNYELVKIHIMNMLKGGQYLHHSSGILWFLTCLLFTEILFVLIDTILKSKAHKVIIIFILYFIAHIQAVYFANIAFIFAIDISFITLAYFAFGVYCKDVILDKTLATISYLIIIVFIIMKKLGINGYGLELWGHNYRDFYLDFIIPISFSIAIFNFVKWFSNYKEFNFLIKLGNITLPIMCLHITINDNIQKVIGEYGSIIYAAIGVVIPFFIGQYVIKKFKYISKILL